MIDKILKALNDNNLISIIKNNNKGNIKYIFNNENDFSYFYTDDEIIVNYNTSNNVEQFNSNKNDNKLYDKGK
tara:strand:- start:2211 stop:2429 length:219 start_codon:yes stop_codon:yes gene_type:complete